MIFAFTIWAWGAVAAGIEFWWMFAIAARRAGMSLKPFPRPVAATFMTVAVLAASWLAVLVMTLAGIPDFRRDRDE